MRKLLVLALLALALTNCRNDKEVILKAGPYQPFRLEVTENLQKSILPFWAKYAPSPDGGFYGTILRDGTGVLEDSKGGVMNARILWTFSTATRLMGLDTYRDLADRAQREFIAHFIDRQHGGTFWEISPDGTPDDVKQTYGIAYGIYGLSEHFRATGNKESLEAAISLFQTMEDNVRDKEKGGYIESFTRTWQQPDHIGYDDAAGDATKTMNTHIHILEAYTNLLRVWPDALLAQRLEELLGILSGPLYDAKRHHLILFCDNDWNEMNPTDSYGHDIETSWLLTEAANVLGKEEWIRKTKAMAIDMVDTALEEGMAEDGHMMYEKNQKGLKEEASWWPQCETMIGCVNAWQLTGDERYMDAALKCWEFTKQYLLDDEFGEWYRNLKEGNIPDYKEAKGSLWNCPYHNSRLGFELMERLAPNATRTEMMAWSNILGVRLDNVLVDFESTLRVGDPHTGKIRSSGREKQDNVRYNRTGLTQTSEFPLNGIQLRQEVTDTEQGEVLIKWSARSEAPAQEGAYFCITFPASHYKNARLSIKGNLIKVQSGARNLSLELNQDNGAFWMDENGDKALYVPIMEASHTGEALLEGRLSISGKTDPDPVNLNMNLDEMGGEFLGLGGNFRLQNPSKDPMVIDYCLSHMRVGFSRVEMPWNQWQPQENMNPAKAPLSSHVLESMEMAKRLKGMGHPLIVSCWFPPEWALQKGSVKGSGGVAALKLDNEKKESIYRSLADYLVYLKEHMGTEADFFSFNESDIGIDVLHTAQEHAQFIREFGSVMESRGLKTKMLLGDNSDATTIEFIRPALNDERCHPYIGAVSFHSWRGCDDATLKAWKEAAESIQKPLIIGEGSTDAAAWRYPGVFSEATFALYEISLYTRILSVCQPLSILQWQLTSDYSLLLGEGIFSTKGPLRPTQRFWNLYQLSKTPEDMRSVPVSTDNEQIVVAGFASESGEQITLHIVNNGAARKAIVKGLPRNASRLTALTTSYKANATASTVFIKDGECQIPLEPESFVTLITE